MSVNFPGFSHLTLPPVRVVNELTQQSVNLPPLKEVALNNSKERIDERIKYRVNNELNKIFFAQENISLEGSAIPDFWKILAEKDGGVRNSIQGEVTNVIDLTNMLKIIDTIIPFQSFDNSFNEDNTILNILSFQNLAKSSSSSSVILEFHAKKMELVGKMIDSELVWAEKQWDQEFEKLLYNGSSTPQLNSSLNKYEDVMFKLLYARNFIEMVGTKKTCPTAENEYPDVFGAMTYCINETPK